MDPSTPRRSPKIAKSDPNLEEDIYRESGNILKEMGIQPFNPLWNQPHLTTKSGPKGQALATCLQDLKTLPKDLYQAIATFGGYELKDYMDRILYAISMEGADHVVTADKSVVRKIVVVRDKAAKNRPIAIFDY